LLVWIEARISRPGLPVQHDLESIIVTHTHPRGLDGGREPLGPRETAAGLPSKPAVKVVRPQAGIRGGEQVGPGGGAARGQVETPTG
jgi:hypothetical protein